jgi:hypothetical protein
MKEMPPSLSRNTYAHLNPPARRRSAHPATPRPHRLSDESIALIDSGKPSIELTA